MLPEWVPTGVAEDFSNTIPIGMDYTCPINKDKLWYEHNMPGLPDVFFEQLGRFENGGIKKLLLRLVSSLNREMATTRFNPFSSSAISVWLTIGVVDSTLLTAPRVALVQPLKACTAMSPPIEINAILFIVSSSVYRYLTFELK